MKSNALKLKQHSLSGFGDYVFRAPIKMLIWLWLLLITWQSRASARAHLATLPDRLLEDAGLTRDEAKREATKPFWRF